jgi:hypothetical protein
VQVLSAPIFNKSLYKHTSFFVHRSEIGEWNWISEKETKGRESVPLIKELLFKEKERLRGMDDE